ncbi:tail fiber protein [uncultured phage_MedDCM-OCT-S35-C6]|uniref:DUF7483 domain-containing protein n=1 Tax=uncultured phage_MedDCM-OCT-S35-C6 TaxID=2741075 RepID=A0A6S4P9P2_9CAUD|nr:tail fiber protein [uncultured phage_MedDCM-OCT-S35-C6]BAQ94165.1 hypothetical protein [uncultured phage_MedDCM-OCT-S35-C6]
MAYSINAKDYFNTKLYTGNGSTNAQTGVGFTPSFTWIKNRGDTHAHVLVDAVRGVTKELRSSGTNAEITTSNSFTSFDSGGFTLGADSTDSYNKNSNNYVSWNWRGNGTGVSNTDGSITSTVSANTTSGFSIVKWTAGSGVSGIGHGLGVVPKLIICKDLSVSSAWTVGSDLLNDWGGYLGLQSSNGLNSETRMYKPSGYSSPTASLFYQDHSAFGSAGENMIAYCFAEKQGFSKFGTYTGRANADNAFAYTGFKPAWIMIKKVSGSGYDWMMFDTKRMSGSNPYNDYFKANETIAEVDNSFIDILSNGFKIRTTDGHLADAGEYLYIAFAEAPLVGNNNVPCTAR